MIYHVIFSDVYIVEYLTQICLLVDRLVCVFTLFVVKILKFPHSNFQEYIINDYNDLLYNASINSFLLSYWNAVSFPNIIDQHHPPFDQHLHSLLFPPPLAPGNSCVLSWFLSFRFHSQGRSCSIFLSGLFILYYWWYVLYVCIFSCQYHDTLITVVFQCTLKSSRQCLWHW